MDWAQSPSIIFFSEWLLCCLKMTSIQKQAHINFVRSGCYFLLDIKSHYTDICRSPCKWYYVLYRRCFPRPVCRTLSPQEVVLRWEIVATLELGFKWKKYAMGTCLWRLELVPGLFLGVCFLCAMRLKASSTAPLWRSASSWPQSQQRHWLGATVFETRHFFPLVVSDK